MLTISVLDRPFKDYLKRLQAGMDDMTPAMADITTALLSESERLFRTESGPLGAWPSLSAESTIPMRMAANPPTWPGKMLQVSGGGLAASVQGGHTALEAVIRSNNPYAAIQYFGGTTSASSMIPGKRIPARPYMPFHPETHDLTPEGERAVLDVLEEYIAELSS